MKEPNQRIIIVLGGSNEIDGSLSQISLSRLDCCLENYQKGDQIICTGGWGAHFNQTPEPHSYYAKNYLMKNGLPKNVFLESALSGHTVDDAVMSKNILGELKSTRLVVITSDFHMKRARLIFDQIFNRHKLDYISAPSELTEDERTARMNHEQHAIAWIEKNGLQY